MMNIPWKQYLMVSFSCPQRYPMLPMSISMAISRLPALSPLSRFLSSKIR